MTHSTYKTIVFDLDGTLLDTWPSLLAAVCTVAPQPHALNHASLRTALSQGLDAMFTQAVRQMKPPAEESVDMFLRVEQAYFDHALSGAVPYAHINEMLQQLTATGLTLALCTNRDRASTLALLDLQGWRPLFSHIQCLDDGQPAKPDPAPLLTTLSHLNCALEDALFVGDSSADARCAAQAGVDFAAHLGGYHTCPNELMPTVMSYRHALELIQHLTPRLAFQLEI